MNVFIVVCKSCITNSMFPLIRLFEYVYDGVQKLYNAQYVMFNKIYMNVFISVVCF